ncbi:MAG TPA: phosphatase PAP2 family protein [Nitrospirae bacterium]|nr:phosphatase PAP2 family protein [Nitrospirota bacterium]
MRPVDTLIFGFIAALAAITIIFMRQIPKAYSILSVYVFLSVGLVFLIFISKKHKGSILTFIHNVAYPYLVIVLVFNTLGGLIKYINPVSYDHILIRLDYLIFGAHPTIALERFVSPIITELLQYAYISYYFLPIILATALIIKKKDAELDRAIFLVALCFFLSYIGYIFIPAIGPRFTMNHIQSFDLHGVLFRDIIDSTLNALEGLKRDAFPSGHTAVSLVVLYIAYRFERNLFLVFLPFVLALMFSTVYLRYHYAVDTFAGVLLAVFTVIVGERIYNKWEKKQKQ